jgi:hypothetical protein
LKIENSVTNTATSSEKIITTKSCIDKKKKLKQIITSNFGWLDRKIEEATVGLRPEFSRDLRSISEENALTISNYILAMRAEINLSNTYRWSNICILCKFSNYHENKSFTDIIRDDILSFLDSLRKPEASDPLHKWIGTYNLYRVDLLRFFKWLYYPDLT